MRERETYPKQKGLVVVDYDCIATISTVDALFVMLVHHVICRVRVSTLGGRGCSLIHSMFIRQETGWDNTARNCILHYLLSATISSLRHKFNFSPNFSSRASSFTSFINAARNLFLVCTMFCRTVQSLTTPSRATAAERLSRLQPHHGFFSLF